MADTKFPQWPSKHIDLNNSNMRATRPQTKEI